MVAIELPCLHITPIVQVSWPKEKEQNIDCRLCVARKKT